MVRSLPSKINNLIIIFYCASLLVVGCASNDVRIDNVARPIASVQKAVLKSMPLGQAKIDKTKRKFTSRPFLFKGEKFVPASNSRQRFVAIVEILGDRRPYSVFIEVVKTRRKGKNFIKVSSDHTIAQFLSKVIQDRLSKSLKNGNVIDDFRVF